MLLAGCSARVSAPETPTDLAWDERIPWDTDSESIYEENLHLFDYDQEAPLDIQELETRRDGNLTVYEITYASPMGGRVPATLIVPDGRGPFAGMVLLHGTSSNRQDFFWMGRRYACMGTVVILIDAPFNRPEHGGPDRQSINFGAGFVEEHTQLIVDLRRAVDLLIVRPDVDPDRITYVGVSYGAVAGGLLAGVEDRVQAYGLMVGDGGLVEHFLGPNEVTAYIGSSASVPDHWVEAMWPVESIHYVSHAAPAALLFQNGANDHMVPAPEAALYQQAGSDPKTIMWYDSGHWPLPPQAHSDQAEWFQQYIGEGRVFVLRPNYRGSAPVLDRVLLAWFVLAAASLVFLIWDLWRDTPAPWGARLMWLLVVVIFGPIGLLAYLVSYRQPLRAPDPQAAMTTASRAFGSTTWGVTAILIGLVIGLEVDRLELPLEYSDWRLFAFLFYIALPAITGLLVFLLAWVATPRDSRYRFPFRRPLLAAIISANMGVAGGWPVFIIIVNRWSIFSALTDPLFWSLLTLTAIAGALAAYPFHFWMVHRGAVQWEAPSPVGEVAAEPEARKPRWFEALGIVLLTYVIVVVVLPLTIMAVVGLTLEELILWLTSF